MSDSRDIRPEDRQRAVAAVNELLASDRLQFEELEQALTAFDMGILQEAVSPSGDYPDDTYDRFVSLVASAKKRQRVDFADPSTSGDSRVIVNPHGTVAHEILHIRLLLIEFSDADMVRICDLVDGSKDMKFEIAHTSEIAKAPQLLQSGKFDVALVDLTDPEGEGMAALARAEVVSSEVPVIPVIRREDEPQALHLGDRQYLIKQKLNGSLLCRTLRNAVEQHELLVELRSTQEREHFHATRDSMTGLPNREHFRDQLQRAFAYARRHKKHVSVLFLDLDRFKHINDTLGHQVGDSLLITMAVRLSSSLRRSDMVARVGGDEFVMMLQGDDLDYAPAHVAEKVLKSLETPFLLDGEEHSITGSIGIATFPRDGEDPDTLIRNADSAMYQAKSKGRNAYQFYSQSMDAVAARKLTVEGQLRRVLERDELDLHFQPRVDTMTGVIVGAEALLRWHSQELGSLTPEEFVPIAEETGLILPIGDWVIRRACAEQKRWREAGYKKLQVSVNLSAKQIRPDTLRESLLNSLMEADLDPSSIEVEITESSLIQNQDVAVKVLEELTELGVGLSLDDFGTGFSSLSYLKRFPVDSLKIDQTFVRDIMVDPDDASIVEAIISIAEKMRLRVVAEGVETIEQQRFLAARGCPEMQGYLFSPPVPADFFFELLRQGQLQPKRVSKPR
ncbi:MAG: EAL domain-containing protein [Proteobacteria bacterium]|nr:EAL domain-containing protein [Pseudomonadota bacterium]